MSTRIGSSVSEFAFVRHRTTYSLALILACATAWTSATALPAAEVLRTSITVRVYQSAGLPSTLEQRALTEAETVLQAALVDVRWRTCTAPSPSAACDLPPGPSELLLRIAREGTRRQGGSATLGDALVTRCGPGGVLATVYVNHVTTLAHLAKADVAMLLGRVAAHELAHLMMHTSAHTRRGLMRPNWTAYEVRRNRAADWAFTAEDVAAMREPRLEY